MMPAGHLIINLSHRRLNGAGLVTFRQVGEVHRPKGGGTLAHDSLERIGTILLLEYWF